MESTSSLSDLLMEELTDLLNAENQSIEVLPKMAEASQSSALKIILENHLKVTQDQVNRLQDIFSNIRQNPPTGICEAIKVFTSEGEDVINKTQKSQTLDTAIIRIVQQIQQYEINGYQKASYHAADLGHTKIVELLSKTLDEERGMNLHLNEFSQFMINVQAINPGDKNV